MSWWGVGATVVGSVIQADAAGDAADAQSGAAASDRALQKEQFDLTRADQAPYREAGYSALNRLQVLLGLAPTGGASGSAAIPKVRSYDQVRASLLPKYMTTSLPNFGSSSDGRDSGVSTINEQALARAIQSTMEAEARAAADAKARQAATTVNSKDPSFGLLTRRFTGADLLTEPGYAFGLQEGTRAREAAASAAGRNLSGATLKALQRYSQDYAGTKFGEAFNRDAAYKDSLFNRLSGISGTGQAATNQVGLAGQNYANNVGNNLIGLSNAQAASAVNRGNIWTNGINSALSAWQRQPSIAAPSGLYPDATMIPMQPGGGY